MTLMLHNPIMINAMAGVFLILWRVSSTPVSEPQASAAYDSFSMAVVFTTFVLPGFYYREEYNHEQLVHDVMNNDMTLRLS